MSSNVVSFWTPCRHDFSCVCDMTSDVSRHVADTTQNVAVWATKSTRRHPTCGAKINCHLFLHWQPLNFLIPITELAQIEQGPTHKWCYEGVRVLGWEGVDRVDLSFHHSPLINKMQHNWCSAASQFSLFTTEFSQTKRRPPHPWCVDRVNTPGWGLVQPQAKRFASCMPPYRDSHVVVVVWLVVSCEE